MPYKKTRNHRTKRNFTKITENDEVMKKISLDSSSFLSHLSERVTCFNCCQYYTKPKRATCGHTLCSSCWIGLHFCLHCNTPIDRKSLTLDAVIQNLTKHMRLVDEEFEKAFDVNYVELTTYNVDVNKDGQNIDEKDFQLKKLSHNIQIHEEPKNSTYFAKVAQNPAKSKVGDIPQAQDDWDKIEVLPDTDNLFTNHKDNVIGPVDITPYYYDNEYSTGNLRRSSRTKNEGNKGQCPELSGVSKPSNVIIDNKSQNVLNTDKVVVGEKNVLRDNGINIDPHNEHLESDRHEHNIVYKCKCRTTNKDGARVPFFRKGPLQCNATKQLLPVSGTSHKDLIALDVNMGDIEINVKVRKQRTTNISLRKKNENDVQININTDHGVQTSPNPPIPTVQNDRLSTTEKDIDMRHEGIESDSPKEARVQFSRNTESKQSPILVPTIKSDKGRNTEKRLNKRNRDNNKEEAPNKKGKYEIDNKQFENKQIDNNHDEVNNENQVFPSIDADIEPSEFLFPMAVKNMKAIENKKVYLAGSHLSAKERFEVQFLCLKRNWMWTDKYTKDLSHLIVSVDNENKSQRTRKYMHALAAGKWIVSYEWVKKCLQTNEDVDEAPYEVLDATGQPAPRRSRVAKSKLFNGITFYCMPPFTVLGVDSIQTMLEEAGGHVVNSVTAARALATAPSLVLAEAQSKEDTRILDVAMNNTIVPVHYMWALLCLAHYTLRPINNLLLYPASLLPDATATWTARLIDDKYVNE